MRTSEQIDQIAAALAKAQGAMRGAVKDSENPHFRSRYADLASVREACWGPLTDHGLSVVQSPRLAATEGGWIVELDTLLMHSSGQWIADTAATPLAKADAQGVGSATTYLRRYALAAFAGIAPEDDDGNAASQKPEPKKALTKPAKFDEWLLDVEAAADNGLKALGAALKAATDDQRAHYLATVPEARREALKAKARAADAAVAS